MPRGVPAKGPLRPAPSRHAQKSLRAGSLQQLGGLELVLLEGRGGSAPGAAPKSHVGTGHRPSASQQPGWAARHARSATPRLPAARLRCSPAAPPEVGAGWAGRGLGAGGEAGRAGAGSGAWFWRLVPGCSLALARFGVPGGALGVQGAHRGGAEVVVRLYTGRAQLLRAAGSLGGRSVAATCDRCLSPARPQSEPRALAGAP